MERDIRGAAAVGQLTEVTAWEAELILNLRLWQDGPNGQTLVWNSYATAFGQKDGRAELLRFERLIAMIDTHMVRPMVRHGVACRCIGSDEAVFANMVRFASDGDLHEASLIATLLVWPAFAEHLALLSAEVGTGTRELVRGHNPARDGLTNSQITRH
ncbi:hypothetical protein ACG74X_13975 [Marivita sp. S0852]|uniref:hypothetical protein n=1 Tax=Marivita sp. S0852 TaxID=3373893 RepID=UPI0039825281